MSYNSRKQTILIVDDIPSNIEILLEILGGDYDVMVAKNGPAAITLAHKESPDLILLDVMMPEMDGYEVCRRLKEDSVSARVPVIFVSALGDDLDQEKAFNAGAVDYLTKPVSPEVVLEKVSKHLG